MAQVRTRRRPEDAVRPPQARERRDGDDGAADGEGVADGRRGAVGAPAAGGVGPAGAVPAVGGALGHRRRGGRGVVGQPLAEEADGQPLEVVRVRGHALAGARRQGQAEEAGLDAGDGLFQLVDLVFDYVEDGVGQDGP